MNVQIVNVFGLKKDMTISATKVVEVPKTVINVKKSRRFNCHPWVHHRLMFLSWLRSCPYRHFRCLGVAKCARVSTFGRLRDVP